MNKKTTGTTTSNDDNSLEEVFIETCPEACVIDKDGFICKVGTTRIIKEQIAAAEKGPIEQVVAIILHRTASNDINLANAKKGVAAHFYIDKDGAIKQVASLKKYCSHIGNIRPRAQAEKKETEQDKQFYTKTGFKPSEIHRYELKKSYPTRYPYNRDSIGIEVVGQYFESRKIWEPLTEAQIKAAKALHACLLKSFGLDEMKDTYVHEDISYKTDGEGRTVLNSIGSSHQ